MYLLQRRETDSFQLVHRINEQIPPYAILSHTWGPNEDEVTFQDIMSGTGRSKAGYRKLDFCADQAATDGLDFFWVDTCCIDKLSSAELTEAILGMFQYYQDSKKCYVYLEDVSSRILATDELAFQKSRWLTRGWTLQELLAPRCVEFFSKEGHQLGSKSSRCQQVAEITQIPLEALQGKALSHFSVETRMKWTEGRGTTRAEDMAYSLLGVFGVFMPVLYGEGSVKAFRRLRREIVDSRGYNQADDVILESDNFEFALQTSTLLHETDDQFSCLMGDSSKDGPPDLIVANRIGTTSENIEVDVAFGSSHYQRMMLRIATPDFTPLRRHLTGQLNFTLTDWNSDGSLDLVVVKKSHTESHKTEVHVLSGASQYQGTLWQTSTILEETDETWSFGMARWSNGQKPDLIAIKKSDTETRTTEVHILSGDDSFQSYILQTGTALHETDEKFDFVVTDWNGDGRPDLVMIKKSKTSGKCTELHVLSGASEFKTFILRAEMPLFKSHGLYEFAVADWSGNKKPDLIAFKKKDTGSNTTEIHVMTQRG